MIEVQTVDKIVVKILIFSFIGGFNQFFYLLLRIIAMLLYSLVRITESHLIAAFKVR